MARKRKTHSGNSAEDLAGTQPSPDGSGGGAAPGLLRNQNSLIAEIAEPKPGECYEAHHLIPVGVAVMQNAVQWAATPPPRGWSPCYDINRYSNGMWLPSSQEEAATSGLPVHSGSHVASYNDYVRELLAPIEAGWDEAAAEGRLDEDYRQMVIEQLEEVSRRLRDELAANRLRLQRHNPDDGSGETLPPRSRTARSFTREGGQRWRRLASDLGPPPQGKAFSVATICRWPRRPLKGAARVAIPPTFTRAGLRRRPWLWRDPEGG